MLHLLYSVPFDLNSTTRRLFACRGDLPDKGLPPVVELNAEAFTVRRYMCAVPWGDHVSHLGGVSLFDWQAMPCKWAGNI